MPKRSDCKYHPLHSEHSISTSAMKEKNTLAMIKSDTMFKSEENVKQNFHNTLYKEEDGDTEARYIRPRTKPISGLYQQNQKKSVHDSSTSAHNLDHTKCEDKGINSEELQILQLLPELEKSRMNWDDYHRLSVIYNFLDELQDTHPSICTVGTIGTSLENREIKVLKITNSQASNVSVWMDAGIHAREWIGPAVCTYIANYIANNFDKLPDNMTNKDWYFLPVANPDGYEYTHTTNRMWRKNKAHLRTGECVGVDLNRNFSHGWGLPGSSDIPNHAFYRGTQAFSEPESRAIRDMLTNRRINFKVYITLHSFGQVIIFPFAYKNELSKSYIQLLDGATAMSKAIYDSTGNIYKVGISRDVMYKAAGTSNDFSHGVAKIPFCYLIELRSRRHKFLLPKEEIAVTCTEILSCVKALMEVVDSYEKDASSSDSTTLTLKVAPTRKKAQVWEVKLIREGQRFFIKTLDAAGALNIWREEESTMDIMVDGQQRLTQVAAMLQEREIPYSIAIKDVNALIDKDKDQVAISKRLGNFGSRTLAFTNKRAVCECRMDWKSYHRLSVIYSFMDKLVEDYPHLCSVMIIGHSVEGRDLKVLKISNACADNEPVWMDAAIHAREWVSVSAVTYIADTIVKNFDDLPESMQNKDWYILPVLNPDGYEYTHTHDRMWRKNRARYGECVGVDLNRNFSFGWGEKGDEGSSDDPGSIFYRGPKPFSEPETDAIRRFIKTSKLKFKVFLSFHSYGEVIIFPWGYTSDPCPDYVALLEGGIAVSKAIFDTTGHTYKVGSTKDLMYYAAGNSVDWSYGALNIPYSYMIELRGKKARFLLPKEEILPTVREVTNGVFRLMEYVDARTKAQASKN